VDLARDGEALALIHALRTEQLQVPIAAIADPTDPLRVAEALHAGVVDILSWPFGSRELAVVMANARERLTVEPHVGGQRVGNEVIFAHSTAMQQVLGRVGEVAGGRGGLCLCGESGTGRLFVARVIHAAGPGKCPFVVADCSDDDIERRIFGVRDRAASQAGLTVRIAANALVAQANGGTLVLRNITETPERVQVKLARILRDREVVLEDSGERVGLELRTIAIVEPSIDAAVAEGRVRRDLFERLSRSRIEIPPLRRRREDLSQLAVHLLAETCGAQGVPPKHFSRSALKLLTVLPWHGNARELKVLLEAMVRTISRPVIELDDVLEWANLDAGARFDTGVSLRDAKAQFERERIATVLLRHHGRVGDAARALGIQRTNLYRKVRQLNVTWAIQQGRR
jgi:DNA-binding NtrC family response regulator